MDEKETIEATEVYDGDGDTSKVNGALLETHCDNGTVEVDLDQRDRKSEEINVREEERLHYMVNDSPPLHLSFVFGLQVLSVIVNAILQK